MLFLEAVGEIELARIEKEIGGEQRNEYKGLSGVVSVAANPAKNALALATAECVYIWTIKCGIISTSRRSNESLARYGLNWRVDWRSDGSALALVTRRGAVAIHWCTWYDYGDRQGLTIWVGKDKNSKDAIRENNDDKWVSRTVYNVASLVVMRSFLILFISGGTEFLRIYWEEVKDIPRIRAFNLRLMRFFDGDEKVICSANAIGSNNMAIVSNTGSAYILAVHSGIDLVEGYRVQKSDIVCVSVCAVRDLFATGTSSGIVNLHELERSDGSINSVNLRTVNLNSGPILSLSWTVGGSALAACVPNGVICIITSVGSVVGYFDINTVPSINLGSKSNTPNSNQNHYTNFIQTGNSPNSHKSSFSESSSKKIPIVLWGRSDLNLFYVNDEFTRITIVNVLRNALSFVISPGNIELPLLLSSEYVLVPARSPENSANVLDARSLSWNKILLPSNTGAIRTISVKPGGTHVFLCASRLLACLDVRHKTWTLSQYDMILHTYRSGGPVWLGNHIVYGAWDTVRSRNVLFCIRISDVPSIDLNEACIVPLDYCIRAIYVTNPHGDDNTINSKTNFNKTESNPTNRNSATTTAGIVQKPESEPFKKVHILHVYTQDNVLTAYLPSLQNNRRSSPFTFPNRPPRIKLTEYKTTKLIDIISAARRVSFIYTTPSHDNIAILTTRGTLEWHEKKNEPDYVKTDSRNGNQDMNDEIEKSTAHMSTIPINTVIKLPEENTRWISSRLTGPIDFFAMGSWLGDAGGGAINDAIWIFFDGTYSIVLRDPLRILRCGIQRDNTFCTTPVPNKGVVLCITQHTAYSPPAASLNIDMFAAECVAEMLLSGMEEEARLLTRQCARMYHFETLMQNSLTSIAQSDRPVDRTLAISSLLKAISENVRCSTEYYSIITQSLRKTEATYWPYVFSVVGGPISIFNACLEQKRNPRLAANFLVVLLAAVDSQKEALRATATLVETLIRRHNLRTLRKVIDFIDSIDSNDNRAHKSAIYSAGRSLLSSAIYPYIQSQKSLTSDAKKSPSKRDPDSSSFNSTMWEQCPENQHLQELDGKIDDITMGTYTDREHKYWYLLPFIILESCSLIDKCLLAQTHHLSSHFDIPLSYIFSRVALFQKSSPNQNFCTQDIIKASQSLANFKTHTCNCKSLSPVVSSSLSSASEFQTNNDAMLSTLIGNPILDSFTNSPHSCLISHTSIDGTPLHQSPVLMCFQKAASNAHLKKCFLICSLLLLDARGTFNALLDSQLPSNTFGALEIIQNCAKEITVLECPILNSLMEKVISINNEKDST